MTLGKVEGLKRFVGARSLTKRQRELLQQYADDVEGRSGQQNGSGSGSPSSANRTTERSGSPNQSQNEEKPPANETNGTGNFTQPSASSEGGDWMSRAMHRIRKLIGI